MIVDGEADRVVVAQPLPTSIWVVAWSSLAGQMAMLLERGVRSDDGFSLAGSMLLGALVVGYMSAGVVRARTIRCVVAFVILVLGTISEAVALFTASDGGEALLTLLSLALTVVTLTGLVMFRGSEWFAWQRTKPSRDHGASIGGLVLVAVLVGMMGGLIPMHDDGVNVSIRVSAARPWSI